MTLSAQKEAMRQLVRQKGAAVPLAQRAEASRALVERVLRLPSWSEATSVLLYLPFPSEPDVRDLFAEAWQAGKRTALLRYEATIDEFEPREVHNLTTDLRPDRIFGQLEPAAHCPALPANQLDLLLVPGVAFSWSGYRLGRGRGYYDRLLARATGLVIGAAFDWQVVPQIPTEPHDVGVHGIVTPTRWQEIRNRQSP